METIRINRFHIDELAIDYIERVCTLHLCITSNAAPVLRAIHELDAWFTLEIESEGAVAEVGQGVLTAYEESSAGQMRVEFRYLPAPRQEWHVYCEEDIPRNETGEVEWKPNTKYVFHGVMDPRVRQQHPVMGIRMMRNDTGETLHRSDPVYATPKPRYESRGDMRILNADVLPRLAEASGPGRYQHAGETWVVDADRGLYRESDGSPICTVTVTVSGPCPDCAHTEHPGQYWGANEVDTCGKCGGSGRC